MYKKILLLPGWMTGLKLYEQHDNLETQIGKLVGNLTEGDWVIGLSLGSLAALRDCGRSERLILINPPLPKRSIVSWLYRWIRFFLSEGLLLERQRFTLNPVKFIQEIIRGVKILGIDFEKILDEMPKDRLLVIRGKNDTFFCDEQASNFMLSKGFRVIELENCGHNWCKKIESAINELTH